MEGKGQQVHIFGVAHTDALVGLWDARLIHLALMDYKRQHPEGYLKELL